MRNFSKRPKTPDDELDSNTTKTPLMKSGGVVKDIANIGANLGATWVNNLSSSVGGIVGNPELIPKVDMVGDYEQRQFFDKVNDVTNKVSGATSQVTTALGMQALGVPAPVTGMVQQGVKSLTEDPELMALGGTLGPEYEAEDKEVVQHDGDLQVFDGKAQELSDGLSVLDGSTHENGGIPASGGERVFSDRLKTSKGTTYAAEAESLGRKVGNYEKTLKSPDSTPIEKRTATLMSTRLNAELDILFKQQESIKANGLNELRQFGGGLKEYKLGGTLPFDEVKFNEAALAKELSPHAYRQQLKNYYSAFKDEIMAYGGVVPGGYNPNVTYLRSDEEGQNALQANSRLLGDNLDRYRLASESQKMMTEADEPTQQGPVKINYTPSQDLKSIAFSEGLSNGTIEDPKLLAFKKAQAKERPDLFEGLATKGYTVEKPFDPNMVLPTREIEPLKDGISVGTGDNSMQALAEIEKLKELLQSEDSQKVMTNLMEYSPTLFNMFQGTLAKKDYYDREDNNQVPQALREIEASKNYNIEDILDANARNEQNLRSGARSVSRNAAEYLATTNAGTAQRNAADAAAYDAQERFMSQANMAAAQARNMIGEQERVENRQVQMNQLQTDAVKRSHLAAGFTGASDITQRNQLDSAQTAQNEMLVRSLRASSPVYDKFYADHVLNGTPIPKSPEVDALKLSVDTMKGQGKSISDIVSALQKSDPNGNWTQEKINAFYYGY